MKAAGENIHFYISGHFVINEGDITGADYI